MLSLAKIYTYLKKEIINNGKKKWILKIGKGMFQYWWHTLKWSGKERQSDKLLFDINRMNKNVKFATSKGNEPIFTNKNKLWTQIWIQI